MGVKNHLFQAGVHVQGCLPLEGGGQGKDRQSLEMSIKRVFFAGAEADLHGAITKFPDILGESLQHSLMGKSIPLNDACCKNYPSCKSFQWLHALHTSLMRKCIFNICTSFLIMKRGKWKCHWGVLAQWMGQRVRAQACTCFPAVSHVFFLYLPIPGGSAASPSDVMKQEPWKHQK